MLLFIYGITSVGATVRMHYCMNEYVGWDILHSQDDNKCGKCGMKDKKSGCCKDEHKQIKISSDQNDQQQKDLLVPIICTAAIICGYAVEPTNNVAIIMETSVSVQPSPPTLGPPLFITYCSFLI